jgi:hypothetical protein
MAEISIIDIRQGPVGPAGPAANVTQANIEAAITDKPGFREAIGVINPINVKDYGAVGDAKRLDDGAITSGDATFTSAASTFTVDDVGKFIRVVGAGAAGADLITTIASRNSAASVELAANAATTVTGATAFHGTDDTDAVQDAIDAASASAYTRTVFFPPGVYLGNWTVPTELHLEGCGGGLQENFDVPTATQLADRQRIPTALIPALATVPVLYYPNWFGNSIRRLMIAGSEDFLGRGLSIGDPAAAASGYTGSSGVVELINICGFQYGLIAARVVDIHFVACNFVDCDICVFGGELGDGVGPMDGCVFTGCITGGANTSYNFVLNSCKAIVITGGDHNLSEHCIRMDNSGSLTITGANIEGIQGAVIEMEAGSLAITNVQVLGMVAPFLDVLGPSVSVDIGVVTIAASGGALINGLPCIYRTAGAEYPNRLPRGYALARYTDTTWGTLNEFEATSRIYELPINVKRMPRITDAFVRGYSTPFGELGWVLTNIAGGAQSGRAASTGPGNNLGLLETYTSTNTSTHEYRFGLTNEIFVPNAQFWELRWTLALSVGNRNAARCRWGLYAIDGVVDFTPQDGLGFHIDRTTPDATLFFECINAGVITRVDTGLVYTELNSQREYIITRNAQGLFCTIKPGLNQGTAPLVPQVRVTLTLPTADYLTPSYFSGSATGVANYQEVYHSNFSLELFQA